MFGPLVFSWDLIGHERKAGEIVLEDGFVRNKRHGNPH